MPTYKVSTAKMPTAPLTFEFRRFPKRRTIVAEILAFLLSSAALAITIIFSAFSWWGDGEWLGMGDGTEKWLTSTRFDSPFAPAAWGYAAWLVVFAAQGAWLGYAWSFTCRQSHRRSISPGVFILFWLACALQLGYTYAVGHGSLAGSFVLVTLQMLIVWACLATAAGYLRGAVTGLKEVTSRDRLITHTLTLNALSFYSSWLTLLFLFHLGSLLTESANVHHDTAGTILLSLLSSLILSFFFLQTTILDRFIRHVVLVYPTVIWWLASTLAQHWDGNFDDMKRNLVFSLVLMCVAAVLLVLHLVLVIVFSRVRPMLGGSEGEEDDNMADTLAS